MGRANRRRSQAGGWRGLEPRRACTVGPTRSASRPRAGGAQHLTEFKAEWLVEQLKDLSKTPASFRRNLELLVGYRLGDGGVGVQQMTPTRPGRSRPGPVCP